jgi:hypothetical protein
VPQSLTVDISVIWNCLTQDAIIKETDMLGDVYEGVLLLRDERNYRRTAKDDFSKNARLFFCAKKSYLASLRIE